MARDKSNLQINLEYYPVKLFFGVLYFLPLPLAEALCILLLKFLLVILPKRRRLIVSNLAACFPDRPIPEREEIGARSIEYLARGIAHYPRIIDRCRRGTGDWVALEGGEHLTAGVNKGNGVICFTAHYGFWEMMAIYVTLSQRNIGMIVRPLDNPKIDALVSTIRSAGGGSVIPHRKALKEGLTMLRKKGVLGILIDQNFYKGGIFVDFFGRPAATTTIVSLLARRTGAVVLPMHNVWEDDRIRVICEPPIELDDDPDPETAMAADTQLMTSYVEKWIRQDPAQWLWLHNRWKRKPGPGDYVYRPPQKI